MILYLQLAAVLFPVIAGLNLYLAHLKAYAARAGVCIGVSVLTAGLVWWTLLSGSSAGEPGALVLIRFSDKLELLLRADGLGRFFAGIVATLWPATALYAAFYMRREAYTSMFFGFFTAAMGITLGIAFAGNLFTMFCFYELLTLVTVPLVIQPMNREASRAAQSYLLFSLGGAAFAFAAMMYLISHGAGGAFALGGISASPGDGQGISLICCMLGILGFGVKAAVFPLHLWLPKAAVAPTPVTALLHAVAVVKAGVFAVIRLVWYCFGADFLRGSWVQTVSLILFAFTIVFGSWMAVRETHWKRRLAYSTVSNLSYILFGIMLLTEDGLTAGLMHMANHSCIKILAFFCAGAVLCQSGRSEVPQLSGLGRRMPVTAACFTVAALALTGIPPFGGFVSKWQLLTAAAAEGSPLSYIGAFGIVLSALLTALYMLGPAAKLWFAPKDAPEASLDGVSEAGPLMTVPMIVLALGCLLLGLFGGQLMEAAEAIVRGL